MGVKGVGGCKGGGCKEDGCKQGGGLLRQA